MCGLLASWGNFPSADFNRALDVQVLRGPDDRGYYTDGDVQLGHRRLSIIDLRAEARQPMSTQNDELVCVFNGEIYNYLELREELEASGYVFRTKSDTEVLINAYHRYGFDCVKKFIGMFAFVVYDKRSRLLFMARDRLGIKPLFYSTSGGGFVAASSVPAILDLGCERKLDLASVSSFFSFRYPINNNSFYEGIEQLPPGHYAVVRDRRVGTITRYWDFVDQIALQKDDRGEEYYLEKLRDLFASSVAYRMRADVPVGAYLSGGVDSSAVVAEMAGLTNVPIKTFTIGFGEKGFNEFEYARSVATRYSTDHHEINVSGAHYLDVMANLTRIKGAPLGVPNEVPLYLMSKELKKHVTVVLSGEGADEIFGGYGRLFRSADDYEKLCARDGGKNLPNALKEKLEKRYGTGRFDTELEHFLFLYRYMGEAEKSRLLGPAFLGNSYEASLKAEFAEIFAEVPHDAGYMTRMMASFEKLHLPGLLQRVDTSTMAASVEARVPFVDHRLVEFAFSIPERYKLKWNTEPEKVYGLLGAEISEVYDTPKYLLKKSMEDKLDHDVLYRRKMGFPVPLDEWFGGEFREYAKKRLFYGVAVQEGILNREWVSDTLDACNVERGGMAGLWLWQCLSLETFLEQF